MIVKIQPPAERIINALMYNELKMSGPEGVLSDEDLKQYEDIDNTGHVLATRNVPELSSLENEFSRLRMLNRKNSRGQKVTNPGFHMSVNPADSEMSIPEQKVVDFVDALMQKLGYGDLPYRIYKHSDIGRTHYHIVTTRIGQDGKKINDSYENSRCNRISETLCKEYGFTLGLENENESQSKILPAKAQETPEKGVENPVRGANLIESPKPVKAASENEKRQKQIVPPYKHDSSVGVDNQLKAIHEDAMNWFFSTPEQYVAILKYRYNTSADIIGDELQFQGLSKNGDSAHEPRPEGELGINALEQVTERCLKSNMKKRKSQIERINKMASECAEKAQSWDEFKKMMSQKGIYTVISWSEENSPFGVTWLDRATRCAFKGSETAATIKWLKEIAEKKGWKITRDRRYEKKPRSSKKENNIKRLRHYSTDEGLKALSRIKAVGHTHGTTNSASHNTDRLKREDEEDRNDIII